jgi:hypothetical protein
LDKEKIGDIKADLNSPWRGNKDLNFWILTVVDKFLQCFLKEEYGVPYTIKVMLKLVVDKAE